MNEEFLKWVIFVSGVLMMVAYLVFLYVNHFLLPVIEDQLKNCKLVSSAIRLWGSTSYFGRQQRNLMVYITLTASRRMREDGTVDIEEVSRISLKHRLWICVPMWVGVGSLLISMVCLALLGKLW